MAKITEIPSACPSCGGEVWDNTKRPKKNPKAPDVACKDKEYCKWAGWLPEQARAAQSSTRPPQEYPHAVLYKYCVQYVKKEIAPLIPNVTPSDLIAATATLFIQASKGGDVFTKKAAPVPTEAPTPPPPAKPAPRNTGMDQGQYAPPQHTPSYDDGDLPF